MYNVYTNQLRTHALSLLWLGYKRLKPVAFAKSDEDVITGDLKRSMNDVIEDYQSPQWVEHYAVQEQIRVNVNNLKGKKRPLIDIEVVRNKRGKRPHLPFEAKRLGRGSTVGDYLGNEGLGAFLDGTYPTTHGEAGMIGYIQEQTVVKWANQIEKRISKPPRVYYVLPNGRWRVYRCAQPPANTYCTIHSDKTKKPLLVIHVLFLFY